jgi:hypothetical protein
MTEGHVYLCKSERKGERYRVWVENRRGLNVEGISLEDACEQLVDLICLKTGDGEAVLEFERQWDNLKNSLVALSCNSSWYPAEGEWWRRADELYEGGICETCCMGIGRRTDTPLHVGSVGAGDVLASWFRFCDSLVASEKFRELLTPAERRALEWRPVELHKKGKRKFFELIPKNPIHEVADRASDFSGWRCPECRRVALHVGGYDDTFVAAADIPNPKAKLFVVQSLVACELLIPASRWKKLRGRPGTSGITTKRVVLVPSGRVVRRLRLPTISRKQIAANRRHHKWQLQESLIDTPQLVYEIDGSVTERRQR